MAQSFTGTINTQDEYSSVSTLTGISFSSGKTYNMQIRGSAYLKIDDAEFLFQDEKFDYKAGGSSLEISTGTGSCALTILEA